MVAFEAGAPMAIDWAHAAAMRDTTTAKTFMAEL